jgi:hypothetical protein
MGTRNLFTIVHDGKLKLAKYNQWDGYLNGQGKVLSEFIVEDLDFEALIQGLNRIVFISEESPELDSIYNNMNTCNDFDKKMNYPLLTRDTTIKDQLRAISIGVLNLLTVDASGFKNDGLFCEYAYELNLDSGMISVFESGKEKCDKLILKCDVLSFPETLDKYIELNKGVKNALKIRD